MGNLLVLIALCLGMTACSNSGESRQPEAAKAKGDVVEVLYFHGKQRCATCIAIEKYTKDLLAAQYGAQQRDSMLVFRNVDLTEEKQLADKYEVTWSSLVVVDHNADGSEKPVNMTEFAFRNARKSPDKFKAGLARQIDEMLKD